MIRITTLSHILVFLLLPYASNAQSTSQTVAPQAFRHNLEPSFAAVVVALVCAFLFVGFFSIYLRHCSDTYLAVGVPAGANINCSSRSPRGIDPKLLETFPILVYSTVQHLKIGREALECAVCLSEFKHHDTLRLLPKCDHVFHPHCIDAWLTSHVTCPVCRAELKPEPQCGENEVAIVITNETNAHQVFDESSTGRTELNSGEERHENEGERRSLGKCHSTGHSLGLVEAGKDLERYTLRLAEDVRRQIMVNHGGIRRSASYDVFWGRQGSLKKGYGHRNCEGEGSSRGRLVLSMTPPFVSRSHAPTTCSSVPSLWASSSCTPSSP